MDDDKTEREEARTRIFGEETTGCIIGYRDGTMTEGGKVTKRGTRVIVDENNEIIGWRQEEAS